MAASCPVAAGMQPLGDASQQEDGKTPPVGRKLRSSGTVRRHEPDGAIRNVLVWFWTGRSRGAFA